MTAETLFSVPAPIMPTFDLSRCGVRPISYGEARTVIRDAHYLGKLGSTGISLGMVIDGQIAGALCFGTIPRNNARAVCGEQFESNVLELTRLALYEYAPSNSASWFIGSSLRWLGSHRPDVAAVVSYADAAVGHAGVVYQATNWVYTGRSTGDYVYQCDDGTVLHPRTTGWDKSALPPGRFRPSSGKHRYVQFVGPPAQRRRARAALKWTPLPYPRIAATP